MAELSTSAEGPYSGVEGRAQCVRTDTRKEGFTGCRPLGAFVFAFVCATFNICFSPQESSEDELT